MRQIEKSHSQQEQISAGNNPFLASRSQFKNSIATEESCRSNLATYVKLLSRYAIANPRENNSFELKMTIACTIE
ncbi:MAG: hypothetical protein AAFQ41_01165 [Cyanobacteria bacterium J06623_7]